MIDARSVFETKVELEAVVANVPAVVPTVVVVEQK